MGRSGRRTPAATPFQSPALIPWWREIGDGELRVPAARANGRLIGLLPLYRQHEGEGGKLLCRSGSRSRTTWTACSSKVAAWRWPRPCCGNSRDASDWRRCFIRCARAHPSLRPARRRAAPMTSPFEPCLAVEIPPEPGAPRRLAEQIRDNLGYFRRRAEQAGKVSFETATASTLSEFLDAPFACTTPGGSNWKSRACLPIRRSAGSTAPRHRFCECRAAAPARAASGRTHHRRHVRVVRQAPRLLLPVRLRSRVRRAQPRQPDLGHSIGRPWVKVREVDFLRGRERFKYFWGVRERPCYGRMLARVG